MNTIYENKNGVKIEVIKKDAVFTTYKNINYNDYKCVPNASFKNMIKLNGYKKIR